MYKRRMSESSLKELTVVDVPLTSPDVPLTLTRHVVDELVKNDKIRETDSEEETGLQLYCNINGNPELTGFERECRGVVFCGDKLILKAFPYPIETDTTDVDTLDVIKTKLSSNDVDNEVDNEVDNGARDNCMCFESHEGALVRMFYFGSKWYTCTHRKLDAYRSKWASKTSFGQSFDNGLQSEVEVNEKLKNAIPEGDNPLLMRFQSLLDKSKQYMFLIRHNAENRIVCQEPDRPTIYHVGTFVEGKLSMSENVYIPYPKRYYFKDINELTECVNNMDPRFLQGIIVFVHGNVQYKVLNTYYRDYFKIRGNEPSIPFQYLRIRNKREDRELLEYLYPHMKERFKSYENSLYTIAQRILEVYKSRYIYGEILPLRPIQEFKILSACHAWHKQDKARNRIHLNKVIEIMNMQPATSLNFLIKQLEIEKKARFVDVEITCSCSRSDTITSNGSAMLKSKKSPPIAEEIQNLDSPMVKDPENIERSLEDF